jgi:two-component sensor histidine kinase
MGDLPKPPKPRRFNALHAIVFANVSFLSPRRLPSGERAPAVAFACPSNESPGRVAAYPLFRRNGQPSGPRVVPGPARPAPATAAPAGMKASGPAPFVHQDEDRPMASLPSAQDPATATDGASHAGAAAPQAPAHGPIDIATVRAFAGEQIGLLEELVSAELATATDTAKSLKLIKSRIEVLRACYDHLRGGTGGPCIELVALLRELAERATCMREAVGNGIEIELASGRVDMASDRATVCALIAHELIFNAVRHAFRGRSQGRISVWARQDGGQFSLAVRDNGDGISDQTLLSGGTGLGLIHALARRIGGNVKFLRNGGTLAVLNLAL